eukprot:gene24458-30809_t
MEKICMNLKISVKLLRFQECLLNMLLAQSTMASESLTNTVHLLQSLISLLR